MASSTSKRKRDELPDSVKDLQQQNIKKLCTGIAGYLQDDSFSDFKVVAVDTKGVQQIFRVHRAIICLHSRYFEKACKHDFSEARTQEIRLHEDDEGAVEIMINYFYTLNVDGTKLQVSSPMGRYDKAKNAVKAYIVADKYEVLGLKSLAFEVFKAMMLEPVIRKSIRAMHLLITCVYSAPIPNTDQSLKRLVIEAFAASSAALLATNCTSDYMRSLLHDINITYSEFMVDLYMYTLTSSK